MSAVMCLKHLEDLFIHFCAIHEENKSSDDDDDDEENPDDDISFEMLNEEQQDICEIIKAIIHISQKQQLNFNTSSHDDDDADIQDNTTQDNNHQSEENVNDVQNDQDRGNEHNDQDDQDENDNVIHEEPDDDQSSGVQSQLSLTEFAPYSCEPYSCNSILELKNPMAKTPLHNLSAGMYQHPILFKLILESYKGNPQHLLKIQEDWNGCTPLHYITQESNVSFASFQIVIDTCLFQQQQNDVFLICDHDGQTPLHWLMETSWDVCHQRFCYLTNKFYCCNSFHKSLSVRDNAGHAPLDNFLEARYRENWLTHENNEESDDNSEDDDDSTSDEDDDDSIVFKKNSRAYRQETWKQLLTVLNMTTVTASTIDGHCEQDTSNPPNDEIRHPLHFLLQCPYFSTQDALKLCVEFLPNSLYEFNNQGLLPIHCLFQKHRLPNEDIREKEEEKTKTILRMLDIVSQRRIKEQAAASITSKENRLALHYAIKTGHSLQVIERLWGDHPTSHAVQDPITGLYPFMLAATAPSFCDRDEREMVNVIFWLMRKHPVW